MTQIARHPGLVYEREDEAQPAPVSKYARARALAAQTAPAAPTPSKYAAARALAAQTAPQTPPNHPLNTPKTSPRYSWDAQLKAGFANADQYRNRPAPPPTVEQLNAQLEAQGSQYRYDAQGNLNDGKGGVWTPEEQAQIAQQTQQQNAQDARAAYLRERGGEAPSLLTHFGESMFPGSNAPPYVPDPNASGLSKAAYQFTGMGGNIAGVVGTGALAGGGGSIPRAVALFADGWTRNQAQSEKAYVAQLLARGVKPEEAQAKAREASLVMGGIGGLLNLPFSTGPGALRAAGEGAIFGGGQDVAQQGIGVGIGAQEEIDPMQAAQAAALGGGAGAALNVGPDVIEGIVRSFGRPTRAAADGPQMRRDFTAQREALGAFAPQNAQQVQQPIPRGEQAGPEASVQAVEQGAPQREAQSGLPESALPSGTTPSSLRSGPPATPNASGLPSRPGTASQTSADQVSTSTEGAAASESPSAGRASEVRPVQEATSDLSSLTLAELKALTESGEPNQTQYPVQETLNTQSRPAVPPLAGPTETSPQRGRADQSPQGSEVAEATGFQATQRMSEVGLSSLTLADLRSLDLARGGTGKGTKAGILRRLQSAQPQEQGRPQTAPQGPETTPPARTVLPTSEAQTQPTSATSTETVPSQPPAETVAREPWQMTRADYVDSRGRTEPDYGAAPATFGKAADDARASAEQEWRDRREANADIHKQYVRKALSEGKPVPPEVLNDYPDLAAKPKKQEPWKHRTSLGVAQSIASEGFRPSSGGELGSGVYITNDTSMMGTLGGAGERFKTTHTTDVDLDVNGRLLEIPSDAPNTALAILEALRGNRQVAAKEYDAIKDSLWNSSADDEGTILNMREIRKLVKDAGYVGISRKSPGGRQSAVVFNASDLKAKYAQETKAEPSKAPEAQAPQTSKYLLKLITNDVYRDKSDGTLYFVDGTNKDGHYYLTSKSGVGFVVDPNNLGDFEREYERAYPKPKDNPAYQFALRTPPWSVTKAQMVANEDQGVPPNSKTPDTRPLPPIGTYAIDKYGGWVMRLEMVDPNELILTEDAKDGRRHPLFGKYIEWAKEGKRSPIYVSRSQSESQKGKLVSSNRRRVLAAIDAGLNEIPAWVDVAGPDGTALKHEQWIELAVEEGYEIPDAVLAEYPRLAKKYAEDDHDPLVPPPPKTNQAPSVAPDVVAPSEAMRVADKVAKAMTQQQAASGFAVSPEGFSAAWMNLEDADKVAAARELANRGLIPQTYKNRRTPESASKITDAVAKTLREMHSVAKENRTEAFSESEAYKKAMGESAPVAPDVGRAEGAPRGAVEGVAGVGASSALKKRGLNGDALANVMDRIGELRDNGAQVDDDGYVTLYHRTTPEKADAIRKSGMMRGEEDGLFFSTSRTGQADGFGDAIVVVREPVERIELDDVFGNEAHVRIPLKRAGQSVKVGVVAEPTSSAATGTNGAPADLAALRAKYPAVSFTMSKGTIIPSTLKGKALAEWRNTASGVKMKDQVPKLDAILARQSGAKTQATPVQSAAEKSMRDSTKKGYTLRDVQAEIRRLWDEKGQDAIEEADAIEETGDPDSFTFGGKVPADLLERLDDEAARRLVRGNVKGGRGEETLARLGADKMADKVREAYQGKFRTAEQKLRKFVGKKGENDPAGALMLAIYDNWPAKDSEVPMVTLDPKKVKAGTTFTINGVEVEIRPHADGGYLVLKDGEDLPITPVDALNKIPVDKGSVKQDGSTAPVGGKAEPAAESEPPAEKKYQYATKYRPAGIGTAPKGFKFKESGEKEPLPYRTDLPRGKEPFGVIEYDRPLTAQEIEDFELKDLNGPKTYTSERLSGERVQNLAGEDVPLTTGRAKSLFGAPVAKAEGDGGGWRLDDRFVLEPESTRYDETFHGRWRVVGIEGNGDESQITVEKVGGTKRKTLKAWQWEAFGAVPPTQEARLSSADQAAFDAMSPEERAAQYPGIQRGESLESYNRRSGKNDTPEMFGGGNDEILRDDGGDSIPFSGVRTLEGGRKRSDAKRIQPSPLGGKSAKNLVDIRLDLGKSLGVNVRTGKTGKAGGFYAPRSQDTVVRFSGDLDTMAHELGHNLDDTYGLVKEWAKDRAKSPFDSELIPHFSQYGSVTKSGPKSKLTYQRTEAVAEWLRAYAVNPEAAIKAAPKFAAHFEAKVPADVRAKIDAFGADIRRWYGANPVDQTVANIRMKMTSPTLWQRMKKAMGGQSGGVFKQSVGQKIWTQLVDDLNPLWSAISAAHELRGVDPAKILPSRSSKILVRTWAGVDRKIMDILQHGPIHTDGEKVKGMGGVDWLLEPIRQEGMTTEQVNKASNDVAAYAISKRLLDRTKKMEENAAKLKDLAKEAAELREILEKAAKDAKPGEAIGGSAVERLEEIRKQMKSVRGALMDYKGPVAKVDEYVSSRMQRFTGAGAGIRSDVTVARETIERLQADPANMRRVSEAASRMTKWANWAIDYAEQSGRLSAAQAKAIRESDDAYVSFQRVSDPDEEAMSDLFSTAAPGSGRRLASVQKVSDRIKGSTRQIENPYVSLLSNTHRIVKEADRNRALSRVVSDFSMRRDMHDKAKDPINLSMFMREAKAGDADTTRVFVNGEAKYYQFAPEIHAALRKWGEESFTPTMLKPVRLAASVLRNLITSMPPFMIRNMIRDPISRGVFSRTGSTPAAQFQYLLKPSEFSKDLAELRRYGGGLFGNWNPNPEYSHKFVADKMAELAADRSTILTMPRKIATGASEFFEASESIGRLAEFTQAKKYAVETLGYSEADASLYAAFQARDLLDYSRAGSIIRPLSQYIPFLNASIQGLARTAQGAVQNPRRVAVKWAAYVLLPSLATYLYNVLAGDEEEYRDLPAWRRDFFMNFKVGSDTWLSIPKPFEMGVLASGVERSIDRMRGNKYALDGYAGSVLRGLMPIDESALSLGLRPVVEQLTNHDFFRDQYIVPPWEEKLDLKLRDGTTRASRLGQLVQDGIGLDARRVDHLSSSLFGTAGTVAQMASDLGRDDKPDAGRRLGMYSTGLLRAGAGAQSLVARKAMSELQSRGLTGTKEYKGLIENVKAVANAKTPKERDLASALLRDASRAVLANWEGKPIEKKESAPKPKPRRKQDWQ